MLPASECGGTAPGRAVVLIKTGGGEVGHAPVAGNGRQTRTFAFSGPRGPPVGAHPAFLVFDHGPGRQGGRSTTTRNVLLGSDWG